MEADCRAGADGRHSLRCMESAYRPQQLFAGYEIGEPLKQFCYRSEIFCRKGDEVTPFCHAGGILGILYFRLFDWDEAKEQIERFQSNIVVGMI